MKYFSQTNETAMESEQMKVVLHGQVDSMSKRRQTITATRI